MTKHIALVLGMCAQALPLVLSFLATEGAGAANLASPIRLLVNGVKSVAVADLNGDGRNDIIVRARTATKDAFGDEVATELVNVYFNQGLSTFSPPQLVWSKTSKVTSFEEHDFGCSEPIIGDFNGDGVADIAFGTTAGTTSVFLNSNGTFDQRIDTSQGLTCKIFLTDIDNDGKLDIVTSGGVLLTGRGNGQFTASIIASERQPREEIVAVGDFDNDGKIDLIVAADELIEFWRGEANGKFSALRGSNTGLQVDQMPSAVATADFNADGFLDIALTDFDTLAIFLGRGNGTFGTRVQPRVGDLSEFFRSTRNISVGDLNFDGRSDLVLISKFAVAFLGLDDPRSSNVEAIYSWVPNGTILYGADLYSSLGDIDGDGKPDLIVAKTGALDASGQRMDRVEVYRNSIAVSRNTAECLFNWAEGAYPSLFPLTSTVSSAWGTYYYRYYLQSNSYLATSPKENWVYYLGPMSNNSILRVGSVPTWLATSGCR